MNKYFLILFLSLYSIQAAVPRFVNPNVDTNTGRMYPNNIAVVPDITDADYRSLASFMADQRNITFFGADPNSTNNLPALIKAISTTNVFGAHVFIPPGRWTNYGTLNITQRNIFLEGAGEASTLYFVGDNHSNGVVVSGQEFTLHNIRLEAPIKTVGTSALLTITNVSDAKLDTVWFHGGRKNLSVDYGNGHFFNNVIFEASGESAVSVYQSSMNSWVNCKWYTSINSADDGPVYRNAAIQFSSDPTYSFKAFGNQLVGNYFRKTLLGHGIYATNVADLLVSGNVFNLSSTFSPGTRDHIHFQSVSNFTVSGNIMTATFNDYIPIATNPVTTLAVAYSMFFDTNCVNGQVNGNISHQGVTGKINNQSTSTLVWGNNATRGSITDPIAAIPNDYVLGFLGPNNTVADAAGLWKRTNNFHIYNGNSILNGLTIDLSGNVTRAGETSFGSFTVNGSINIGANHVVQIYDSASEGIYQQNNKDWNFFDSNSGTTILRLTPAGLGSFKSTVALTGLTTNRVLVINNSKEIVVSSVTTNQLHMLNDLATSTTVESRLTTLEGASGEGVTNVVNLGGGAQIGQDISANVLQLNTITNGAGITISSNANTIVIAAAGGGSESTSVTNLGDGIKLGGLNGTAVELNTITNGLGITITSNANVITFALGDEYTVSGTGQTTDDSTPLVLLEADLAAGASTGIFEVNVAGHYNSGGTYQGYGFTQKGLATFNGGGTAMLLTLSTNSESFYNGALTIGADPTITNPAGTPVIRVTVLGASGKTMNWKASARFTAP